MNRQRNQPCEKQRQQQIEREVKKYFSTHRSTIEQIFSTASETIDRETFAQLLRSSRIPLTDTHLQLLIEFCQSEDKLISLKTFRERFFPSAAKPIESNKDQCQMWNYVVRLSTWMLDIRSDLVKDFLCLDRTGQLFITIDQAMKLMKKYSFPLTEEEQRHLAILFSPKRNGQFNYFDFMQHFVTPSSQVQVDSHRYSRSNFIIESKQNWTYSTVTIEKIYSRIRSECRNKYQSIARMFRMIDQKRQGSLDQFQFDQLLKNFHIELNGEELYHLMSDIDRDQDGRISYVELYRALISDPLLNENRSSSSID